MGNAPRPLGVPSDPHTAKHRRLRKIILRVAFVGLFVGLTVASYAVFLFMVGGWDSSSWARTRSDIGPNCTVLLEDDLGSIQVPDDWSGQSVTWVDVPVWFGQEDTWGVRQTVLLKSDDESEHRPPFAFVVIVLEERDRWLVWADRASSDSSATPLALPPDVLVGRQYESHTQSVVTELEDGTSYWHSTLTVLVDDPVRPLRIQVFANHGTADVPLDEMIDYLRCITLRVEDAAESAPESVVDALSILRISRDPERTLPAEGYLVSASRDSTEVVQSILESAHHTASAFACASHASALASIWSAGGDSADFAHAALLDLLEREDTAFEIAIMLAWGGDATGAPILSAVAAAAHDPNATVDDLESAEEARYWLQELGSCDGVGS